MEYLLLFLGFAMLLLGGRYLVTGSVAVSTHFKLSKLLIGVTVVSFGTSAPELFVSCRAALMGVGGISVGNVVGSNIANIGLVLALTAIVFPIMVKSASVKIDAPFLLVISGLFYFFILDGQLVFYEGLVFIILLISYLVFIIRKSRKEDRLNNVEFEESHLSIWVAILMVLGATIGLAYGSRLLIDNARIIAAGYGIPERIIGITVIALGTSLPELATSLTAAFRKEMDISIGNIIGSNIFNILAVLGVTSAIIKVDVEEKFINVDVFWMIGLSILLYFAILPAKKGKLTRLEGLILFLVYCTYMYFLVSGIE